MGQSNFGDTDISGRLTKSGAFVNTLWSARLALSDAVLTAATLESITYDAGDVYAKALRFPNSGTSTAGWCIPLPDDYDGSALNVTYYWTSPDATTGIGRWSAKLRGIANDDAIAADAITEDPVTDAFIAQGDLHVVSNSIAPVNATGAKMLSILVIRYQPSVNDTLDGNADLLGVQISYA